MNKELSERGTQEIPTSEIYSTLQIGFPAMLDIKGSTMSSKQEDRGYGFVLFLIETGTGGSFLLKVTRILEKFSFLKREKGFHCRKIHLK